MAGKSWRTIKFRHITRLIQPTQKTARLISAVGRRNAKGLNMQEYEGRIKLKFKLLANFYDLFDIPFRLNRNGNPRLALAKKIPNATLHILDLCVGTANSAIAVAEANDQNEIIGIDLSQLNIVNIGTLLTRLNKSVIVVVNK